MSRKYNSRDDLKLFIFFNDGLVGVTSLLAIAMTETIKLCSVDVNRLAP